MLLRTSLISCFLVAGSMAFTVSNEEAKKAVEHLFSAAREGSEQALIEAAQNVLPHGSAATEYIVTGLAGRTPLEIVWGLRTLKVLGSPVEGMLLIALAHHAEASVRAEAIVTGAKLLGAEFFPVLEAAVKDDDLTVRRRAFDGVRQSGSTSESVIRLAMNGAVDTDFWISTQSLCVLNRIPLPGEKAADPLLQAVEEVLPRMSDPGATGRVFQLLVKRQGLRLTPVLLKSMEKVPPAATEAAFDAAASLRVRDLALNAQRFARTGPTPVAKAAIRYLAKISHRDSAPLLVDLLAAASEPEMRETLAVALRIITGELHGYDVAAWRRSLLTPAR